VKSNERLQIESQVNAFLEAGGRISRFGNMSGHQPVKTLVSQNSQKAEKTFKGTLGITRAARYKGVSRTFLAKCIRNGTGPKHYLVDDILRFIKTELDAWTIPQ